MSHVAIDRKLVAGPQMPDIGAHGQPHLALNDERPDRERVRVGFQIGSRGPLSLHDLIEPMCPGLRFERLESD